MRPRLELLEPALVERVLDEAFQLLCAPGVRVQSAAACELLSAHGARVADGVARIPEELAHRSVSSAPREFWLHDRTGKPSIHYGGDAVHFAPGSSCLHVLDAETFEHRPAISADLVRLVQVAESLPQYAAQSTAVVCDDVPETIKDFYRLFLVLWHSEKPVVTGAFGLENLPFMIDMLAAEAGGQQGLRAKPRAVFDVCPSPPLTWSEFAGQSLVELARTGVPAEIVAMPVAGAAAPVTLAGSVAQHAAECLSGIVIHQLAQPGAPVVWGGAPSILDMRTATTPMGAVETAMLNAACAQVGKYLGLPTHGYLVGGDSKIADAQAGMESGMAAVLAALAGINMVSGAGMLDFLACHSAEKLVMDAEAIGSALRLVQGIEAHGASLAVEMFRAAEHQTDFLKLPETRRLFRSEQFLPSPVTDRESLSAWVESGGKDMLARSRERVRDLVADYTRPAIPGDVEKDLLAIVRERAASAGLHTLPGI
ncbi:MAG TPA: trimethylamine methyltransferase family protein [Terriglobales bacterium]|nr:trimethylamine methyltransferase family protein [Terriglobales bacterium]